MNYVDRKKYIVHKHVDRLKISHLLPFGPEMLTTINGSGAVHQKTRNRLVSFIDQFKSLNFTGDSDMEAQLDRVRQEFLGRNAAAYRDNTQAHDRLVTGLSALRDHASTLATADAQDLVAAFGAMGARKLQVA